MAGAAICVNQKSYIAQACTPPKYIIPDTGCTGHYVPTSIQLYGIMEVSTRVQMPDEIHIQSTHCVELPLLQSLPNAAARIAHKIAQLTQSLLSISKL